MDQRELKLLRSTYHTFRRLRDQFVADIDRRHTLLTPSIVSAIEEDVTAVERASPGLLPKFDRRTAEWRGQGEVQYYTEVVLTYTNRALSRLEAALESPPTTPVTEEREFTFVRDTKIRDIVERDYAEIQRAFIAECWKSVIILSGGAIEAMLVDLLEQNRTSAQTAASAPKSTELSRWVLSDLIAVAVELKLVSAGAEKLSHSIREYRNLVHPGNEIRNGLSFGREEARIALEVLHIIHRDLTP